MRVSGPEILVVLVVFLLMFGGTRLPELGRGLGLGLRGFRDALRGTDEDATSAAEAEKKKAKDEANKTS